MNTRRQFLVKTGLACAGLAALRVRAGAVAGAKKVPVGLQMYSFRKQAEKDFAGAVKKAAEIGYRYIEPCFLMGTCLLSNAGYCHLQSLDTDPEYFKDFCREQKLKISGVSSHSDLLDTLVREFPGLNFEFENDPRQPSADDDYLI